MASGGPLRAFLQRADPASAGNSCDIPIGDMTWAAAVGTVRFQVPDVPPGSYWLLVLSEGACERFGTRAGALLTLNVLPSEAKGPAPTLVAAVVAFAATICVLAVVRWRRREGR